MSAAGFVSIEEIYNVMAEWLTKLDTEVMAEHQPFHRPSVMFHCDNLKHELAKRCTKNLADLAKVDEKLARQIDIGTRVSSSHKPLTEQVREAEEHFKRATAPSLEEQLQQRRNLGKEIAKREAMGLDPQHGGRR